jgi:hypothetical protein
MTNALSSPLASPPAWATERPNPSAAVVPLLPFSPSAAPREASWHGRRGWQRCGPAASLQSGGCGAEGGGGVGGCASSLVAWACRPRSGPFGPDLGSGGPRPGHASEGSLQAAWTFPRRACAEALVLDSRSRSGTT